MTGHAFGWSAAVYNYNRRARLKQEILREEFWLPAFAYYDDLFGLETTETIESAEAVARGVHEILGILYGEHKVSIGAKVGILGVGYDLPALRLRVTQKRKRAICDEIGGIIKARRLSPGAAGKFKGRLTFVAGQLWGRLGRHLMPTLSQRQYMRKSKHQNAHDIAGPLQEILVEWHKLIANGRTRDLVAYGDGRNDAIICTDGWTPDWRFQEKAPPGVVGRIGATMFHKCLPKPLAFEMNIPEWWAWAWTIQFKASGRCIVLFGP